MNLSNFISKKLQKDLTKTFKRNVNKFLSTEVQQELGLKKIRTSNEEMDLHDFWAPVQSNLLSHKKREKYSTWITVTVVALIVILLFLIFSLVSPNKHSYKQDSETVVVINGKKTSPQKVQVAEEVSEPKPVEKMTSEDIRVENIVVNSAAVKEVVAKSPLLKGEGAVTEYKVQSGDTIEKIAIKFYGEYSADKINKIKFANNIKNPRYLQVGQKLVIPFN